MDIPIYWDIVHIAESMNLEVAFFGRQTRLVPRTGQPSKVCGSKREQKQCACRSHKLCTSKRGMNLMEESFPVSVSRIPDSLRRRPSKNSLELRRLISVSKPLELTVEINTVHNE